MRLLAVLSSLLLISACSFARIGILRTLTGGNVEGQVRITPGGVVVVNAAQGWVFETEATNIAQLSFPTNIPARAERPTAEIFPADWREADINADYLRGSTRYERGAFTVRSAGVNIGGESDSFHYVYKSVHGNSEIIAAVPSIHYTHPNAKAGLMMRENLGEYSRNVTVATTAAGLGGLQWRRAEHGGTETAAAYRGIFAPLWMKLKRRGNEFTASVSANGRAWSVIGTASIPMADSIYVGLALASAREDVLNWTTFSRVREAPRLVNEDFTPEVELVSGSIVAGRPSSADANEILFGGAPKVMRVPTSRVARIVFHPLSTEVDWKTRVSRPGVWVSRGDFFDGEFQRVEGHDITISSVLYGLRTFDVDDEVLALVLRARRVQPAAFDVLTMDGSTLRATDVVLGDGELKLKEAALGEVRVPTFEIVEMRRR